MMVRGGGSVVDRSIERSGAGVSAASSGASGSAGISALSIFGTIPAGQSVAQLGAQFGLQQSMSSWLMPDDDDPAMVQSIAGTANAGLEASAKDKASTIKAIRRRMTLELRQPALTCNYGPRTFAGSANPVAITGIMTSSRRNQADLLVAP